MVCIYIYICIYIQADFRAYLLLFGLSCMYIYVSSCVYRCVRVCIYIGWLFKMLTSVWPRLVVCPALEFMTHLWISDQRLYTSISAFWSSHTSDQVWYGVATISRLLQIIGLFCKRALQKRLYISSCSACSAGIHDTRMNQSCQRMDESCHTYGFVKLEVGMHHGRHMNQSCHTLMRRVTHGWIMPRMWMCHVTHRD